ncbi:serine hydrolase domain-containing protein [Winogradskyella immobilis]|uniref:Beta-lactamase family protein n=1 Tax=Winogradskyella immobilis TaxID=2816852 RepID=A0ABS8EQP2_9FLAO|nr:serine hydrolase domain-containing protein [Winogradskyella immobilis]MCC1485553.1 beta-lactamase family protein [Winogradskyella immobilis]MCG0017645.1 beta-lactamase family protein [Winogradskyella immobilis]
MKNLFLTLLIGAFCLTSCKEKSEIEKSQTDTNPKALKLDTLYSELHNKGAFNGSVLVAENGRIIFEKSYGLADEETNRKLNDSTVFELASVSKQFTAMGIVQLEKEGKLYYDDDITKFVPELIDYKGITIKNLLNHTGGLPDYMELADTNWEKSKIATNDDILKMFGQVKPKILFEPNEKWDYSNTGYLILGTIIERASGKEFGEYLNDKIFGPLDMQNTFVYRRRFEPKEIENYANGYIYSDSLQKKILPDEIGKDFYVVYLDGIVGDGMVNSNPTDLLKWDRALYGNKLVNNKDLNVIFSSSITKDSLPTDYGFGWMIDSTKIHGKVASHSGGWAGYISYIERNLDNDKTIIVLQNNSLSDTEIPIKNTRRILYNQEVEKPIKLDYKTLKLYSGKYLRDNNKEREIALENDKLYVVMSEDYKMELVSVSETKFIVDGWSPEVSYTFILDDEGNVEKYRVIQESQGVDKTASRIK